MIDVRKIPATAPSVKHSFKAQHYCALNSSFVYPADAFSSLAYHERRFLLALAAGLTSTRSVLVGRAAARMWGMWVIATTSESVEVALPRGNTSPSRAADKMYTYRYSRLADDQITVTLGVRVTNRIRTFIDIARYHGFVEGLVAVDGLLRMGADRQDIARAVEVLGRFKGVAIVRRCLAYAVTNSDSPYESYARALLIEAGFDEVVTQFRIGQFRADLCLGGWLLVEIDGRSKYEGEGGQQRMYQDLLREREIGNRGYVFLRFPPAFLLRHPDRFVAQVAEAFAGRARAVSRA